METGRKSHYMPYYHLSWTAYREANPMATVESRVHGPTQLTITSVQVLPIK